MSRSKHVDIDEVSEEELAEHVGLEPSPEELSGDHVFLEKHIRQAIERLHLSDGEKRLLRQLHRRAKITKKRGEK